ncbi:hypothetical protein BP6252_11305 [Coleophoma cylindrospora]|uniref:N-acetyltransferase domain-containing protein n=1 Tax=Coleophoma cylindrospora TaxID=1849047 RepID=A0A3D8QQ41_9HELO|nr:hypothetical protein BP6252_11305 [Coleophoma cylindrospora]
MTDSDPAPAVIQLLPPEAASNPSLVSEITTLVNQVYLEAEGDFFVETHLRKLLRTDPAQVTEYIQLHRVYTATHDGHIIGCIKLQIEDAGDQACSAKVGHLGLFAVSSSQRRSGLGRRLVEVVEKDALLRGCQAMELEILTPKEGGHVFKDFLKVWYSKMGYRVVRTEELADSLPFLVPDIIRPSHLVIYQKHLVEESEKGLVA